MRRRLLVAPLFAATALLLPSAHAAPTALVVADPTGDATFSGLHGQTLPVGSQAGLDIVSVTFDTAKKVSSHKVRGRTVKTVTPTGLLVTIKTAAAPSTTPGSSYGIMADHSLCEGLRLQVYYTPTGVETYGDLAACGDESDPVSPGQFPIEFSPKVSGSTIVISIPFKLLPKQVKVGTLLDGIVAYTSTAEPTAGYQPTDFVPEAGIDTATAAKPWKIA